MAPIDSSAVLAWTAPRDAREVHDFLPALRAALDGTGPPLAPLPDGPPALRQNLLDIVAPHEPAEVPDLAAVVTTSGSTGQPKGVLLGRTALRASAIATHVRLGGPARWVLALPVHHVAGLQILVRSVVAGTDPVVIGMRTPFDGDEFVRATESATGSRLYTSLVPVQLRRLLATGNRGVAALRAYNAVLVGGAAIPADLLHEARFAGVAVVATYGMTETSGGCVYDGQPLDGVEVRSNADGRLEVRGPVLAAGYRLQPQMTEAHFAEGWFTTGDLGTVDPDRSVHVLGRADDIVVTGGENVSLTAVEAAVAALPDVSEAAAFARADDEWGQRIGIAVVPRIGRIAPSTAAVKQAVTDALGRHGAPRDFLLLDALPLLDSGKVDRSALERWRS